MVWMGWRPARWSVCLPLLIFPCTMKFSSGTGSPGWSQKKGRKMVVVPPPLPLPLLLPFYGCYSGQPAYPAKNQRILPEQSFTARMLLLMATSVSTNKLIRRATFIHMVCDILHSKTQPLHTFILGFADVTLAGEESLMILCREVHVVVRQRFLRGRLGVSLILRSTEQVH